MGYLQRTGGAEPAFASFSKGVISAWFHVPQASLDAAREQYLALGNDFTLPGIVPIFTFGPDAEQYENRDTLNTVIATGSMSPCVIGISCGEAFPGSEDFANVLYARLQYASGGRAAAPATISYHDFFQVGAKTSPSSTPTDLNNGDHITVSAGVWHHVLVSFDMSGGCSTSPLGVAPYLSFDSTCDFSWAMDDINYTDNYLWPNTPAAVGASGEGIVSDTCMDSINGGSFSAGAIPTSGRPIGIPASGGFSDFIYHIELARLQVFTGVFLDTSTEENRRAFITSDLRPASLSLARGLLGKIPEIEFDKAEDIIAGRNSGSLGNFGSTGTITAFTPGPGF